VLETYIISCI